MLAVSRGILHVSPGIFRGLASVVARSRPLPGVTPSSAVAQNLPLSRLTNPHLIERTPMTPTITHILVPTDFSTASDAALDFAKTVAGTFGASLHLLHVFEDPVIPAG